ncbi:MAG: hypothetical protein GY799_30335 [Desulfobulbaceae bacterium]|nr:hypothetical protein [Desulfobulbaceae bacterium]
MSFLEFILSIVIIVTAITLVTLFFNKNKVPGISSDNDVLDLVKKGDTLTAIKAYRQLHGTGLKEAKIFVENHKEDESNG